MSQAIDVAMIQQFHYFQELSEAEARLAAEKFEPLSIPAGEVLFRQGDVGAWIYLLVQGEIEISVNVPGTGRDEGSQRTLTVLHPPAILGEMSLLLDEPRAATATARTDCEVWQISREQFLLATASCDQWAHRFLLVMSKILASRVSEMNRQLVGLIADKKDAKVETPSLKVAELEELRDRLFTQWSF